MREEEREATVPHPLVLSRTHELVDNALWQSRRGNGREERQGREKKRVEQGVRRGKGRGGEGRGGEGRGGEGRGGEGRGGEGRGGEGRGGEGRGGEGVGSQRNPLYAKPEEELLDWIGKSHLLYVKQ